MILFFRVPFSPPSRQVWNGKTRKALLKACEAFRAASAANAATAYFPPSASSAGGASAGAGAASGAGGKEEEEDENEEVEEDAVMGEAVAFRHNALKSEQACDPPLFRSSEMPLKCLTWAEGQNRADCLLYAVLPRFCHQCLLQLFKPTLASAAESPGKHASQSQLQLHATCRLPRLAKDAQIAKPPRAVPSRSSLLSSPPHRWSVAFSSAFSTPGQPRSPRAGRPPLRLLCETTSRSAYGETPRTPLWTPRHRGS